MTAGKVKSNFIVSRIYGAYYEIYSPESGMKRAILKGKLRTGDTRERHPFVVGDYIEASPHSSEEWIISSRLERRNFLTRKSSMADIHVLCANVDYIAVIASLGDPETKEGFIDRVLIAATSSGIEPVILFTKSDLVTEQFLNEKQKVYSDHGYRVFSTSTNHRESIHPFLDFIDGKTVFLAGNSGVGKSSLINLIRNESVQKTNTVSTGSGKGKHTTTNSNAIVIGHNTILIDSPGIKEWGLLHLTHKEIIENFPDFRGSVEKCISIHCCDENEECEINMLIGSEKIPEGRQKSFESILESLDSLHKVRTGNKISGRTKGQKSR